MASLDSFVNKGQKIFYSKRSRLEVKKPSIRLSKQDGGFYHLKTGHKKCPRDDHSKLGLSGFRMYTVYVYISTAV
jgi:hypothetical protein